MGEGERGRDRRGKKSHKTHGDNRMKALIITVRNEEAVVTEGQRSGEPAIVPRLNKLCSSLGGASQD